MALSPGAMSLSALCNCDIPLYHTHLLFSFVLKWPTVYSKDLRVFFLNSLVAEYDFSR